MLAISVIAAKRMAREIVAAFLWFLSYFFMRLLNLWELPSKYYMNPTGDEWVGSGKKLPCYQ